mmetsp:Transcript_17600/g.34470  ORF Transcript_17600/g.34470 Transcript_17600/m.34470 type:complete len:97 (+) Transcript_17600:240-530(+)
MQQLEKILRPLRARNEALRVSARRRGARPATVEKIAGDYGIAEICCLIDATDYPDVDYGRGMLEGFQITGDLPDDGVHRLVDPNVTLPEFERIHAC